MLAAGNHAAWTQTPGMGEKEFAPESGKPHGTEREVRHGWQGKEAYADGTLVR